MAFAAVSSISLSSSSSFSYVKPPICVVERSSFHLKRYYRQAKQSGLVASRALPLNSNVTADEEKWDAAHYEALISGGEQVTSVLEEMTKLLSDMNIDETSEEVAVHLVAQGVIGKRVDEMESGFMLALDYMIKLAERDQDDKRKSLLEMVKETVLSHLTKKCPPHVQVVGLLCRTPAKDSRHELLRRVAAGGGVFKGENDTKIHLPGANLNEIANQADDLLETMESRPVVPDRKLLARLVLIREEARNMMGGGLLDERNDRGLNTLPEPEVMFLTKLVALRPGKPVRDMIKAVMEGKNEGADLAGKGDDDAHHNSLPVRPGMFLETVSKVLGSIYAGNKSGITAQHLEWVKCCCTIALITIHAFLSDKSSLGCGAGSSEYTANTSRDRLLVLVLLS